jgi:hypothetical protein
MSPVATVDVPLPALGGGLGLGPTFLLLGGLLAGLPWPLGTVTAVLLACPPNTLEKLLMGCLLALVMGRFSLALSEGGWPIHALVAHFLVILDITSRFHQADMVLTGCSSLLADRQA